MKVGEVNLKTPVEMNLRDLDISPAELADIFKIQSVDERFNDLQSRLYHVEHGDPAKPFGDDRSIDAIAERVRRLEEEAKRQH